ncbi:MAG TPA: hypothetical protein VI197_06825 [Polyangiaceae bacterium]
MTALWKGLRGQLAAPVDLERLPASLLERYAGEPAEQLVALLRQLSPLSLAHSADALPEHAE